MEILSSLGLLVLILVAFGVMAGGRASSLLRPAIRIVDKLLAFAIRGVTQVLGAVFRVAGGSVKLPRQNRNSDSDHGPGPPPPRWKD